MVEGDDQSIDIVTYEDVTVHTTRGPVTKRVLVPVRPLEDDEETREVQKAPDVQMDINDSMPYIDDLGTMGSNDGPEEPTPRQKNKVCLCLKTGKQQQ